MPFLSSVGAAMAMGTATVRVWVRRRLRDSEGRHRADSTCWDAGRRGSRRNKCTRALLAGFAVGGLFVGCRCGSPTSDPPSNLSASVVTTSNQQDAVFASQLIELSEQLVSITDILDAKTDDPAISAKMDELSRTANERIVLAKSWLKLWGRTAVEAPRLPAY